MATWLNLPCFLFAVLPFFAIFFSITSVSRSPIQTSSPHYPPIVKSSERFDSGSAKSQTSRPPSPRQGHKTPTTITFTSGGCHGFQYLTSLEPESKIDVEEDTVFEGEEDVAVTREAKVVVDAPSLELLLGSSVDYTTELIGSQFEIVNNPRAASNYGCRTSFDIID